MGVVSMSVIPKVGTPCFLACSTASTVSLRHCLLARVRPVHLLSLQMLRVIHSDAETVDCGIFHISLQF